MSKTPAWRRYLTFWRTPIAQDVDDELRFHTTMRVKEYMARGMSEADARRAVAERLGDMNAAKSECIELSETRERNARNTAFLDAFLGDLRYALRVLRVRPGFTAAVVVTLGLGIGAATAIFGVVNAILLRPLPYPDANRLVAIVNDMPSLSATHNPQSIGTYLTFQRYAHTLARIALYEAVSANVSDAEGRSDPVRLNAARATASLFPTLEVAPMRGRPYTEAEDVQRGPNVVVISERLWRTRFGADPHIMSRTIVVDGKRSDIVGVMPKTFDFPRADVDLWLPLRVDPNVAMGGFAFDAVARLASTATPESAARELAHLLPRVPEITPDLQPGGMPMATILEQAKPVPRVIPLREDMVGGAARALWVVAAAALLVLLVTCANVTNLYLVRADARRRELAVRTALGAGRGRVLAHFFAESLVLSVGAVALGILFAALILHYLVAHGPAQLPRLAEVRLDGAAILFALATSALVAIGCSTIPALRALGGNPLADLRESTRAGSLGGRRQRTRNLLVAGQVALAMLVLSASTLLARSFSRLHAVQPGFDPHGVAELWLSLPPARYPSDSDLARFSTRLADAMSQVPGVEKATVAAHLPFVDQGVNLNPVYVESAVSNAGEIPPAALYVAVDSAYFGTLRIPFIAGHNFDANPDARRNEAIITREAARVFFYDATGRAAINKRFRKLPDGPWHTIVGVLGDIRDSSLAAGPTRVVYLPIAAGGDLDQIARSWGVAARTRGDPATVTRAMVVALHTLDPLLPAYLVQPMGATLAASTAQLSFTVVILGVAAAMTLVLGMVGLYGVLAYVVMLRTRELGLRIALGAQPRSIARMITAQGLALAGAGIVIGMLILVFSARLMRSLLFGVGPTDPESLLVTAALLLACTMLSCWLPARRAARLDPLVALGAE
ncbi:MAG TPA: ABC transporter permease [Gemmatimonadaceae bacterium]|nr:ABC transporter permease [Gemmatimonadaceae bacterium]